MRDVICNTRMWLFCLLTGGGRFAREFFFSVWSLENRAENSGKCHPHTLLSRDRQTEIISGNLASVVTSCIWMSTFQLMTFYFFSHSERSHNHLSWASANFELLSFSLSLFRCQGKLFYNVDPFRPTVLCYS